MIGLAQPAELIGRAPASAARPLRCRPLEDPGVRAVFTGRAEGNVSLIVGDGDPVASRERAAALVGLAGDELVAMEQVHGAAVARVGRSDRGRATADRARGVPGVDALVTTDLGVGLMVMAADCVPVLLALPGAGVAAAHAGRAGVVAGVVSSAVRALAACGVGAVSDVIALVGPAIGGCCYEVPQQMADAVVEAIPAAAARTAWGAPSLDLPAAVASQLEAIGVARVERVGSCTRCDHQRWFSHRRAPGQGRQAGIICRAPAPRPPGGVSID